LGERIGLSDAEWALIGPLLPAERGRGCRPAGDNRPFFKGMMWMLKNWRCIASHYDETAESCAGFVKLVSVLLWLSWSTKT
jgi:transposase